MLTKTDILTLRSDLGESQEKFGTRFGVKQSAVALWEKKGPPKRGLVAIALGKLRTRTPAKQEGAAA
jgi:DNA-binding transcriptional regulator YiaG